MNVRILIVDDEQSIRDMLSRHFRYLGFEVNTAANGQEALEKLDTARHDVVISDIKMPVMDGIDLLRQIRARHPMTHTIIITGYVTLDNALACMRLGAETFVFKPLEDLRRVEQAVEHAVESIQHWCNLLGELRAMKPITAEAAHG
ncbi:MAG: response regulator [Phycisphaeraceae bacterium]|nr:response regulator [Phycisphaeraceae bacterium]